MDTLNELQELEYLKKLIEKNSDAYKSSDLAADGTIPQLMYQTVEALYEFILIVQEFGLYPENEADDIRVDYKLARVEVLIESFVDLTELMLQLIPDKKRRTKMYNHVSQFIFYSLNLLDKIVIEHENP